MICVCCKCKNIYTIKSKILTLPIKSLSILALIKLYDGKRKIWFQVKDVFLQK